MAEENMYRLWKPIAFSDVWRDADTSVLDDLSSSWFARRENLQLSSAAFQNFLGKLKREHAIETGVVERLYDIDRGVTRTLIEKGFVEGLLSHGDANIPSDQLLRHLNDHMEAMDFVFDLIKESRPLTASFIKELHQLVTRSQATAEGRDALGNRTRITLLRGTYKEWENNPTRPDGTVIMYCPPLHVASEMDRLIHIYHSLEEEKLHPLIIAAWVHHAFTTIHPFQDGNGRVVRLLASLILIKHHLFPITVLREEAKLRYIQALEKADADEPNDLVVYFAEIQKRQIERALNVEPAEEAYASLHEVKDKLANKLSNALQGKKAIDEKLVSNREWVWRVCESFMGNQISDLRNSLGENVSIRNEQLFFGQQIPSELSQLNEDYRQEAASLINKAHSYHFNQLLPFAWNSLMIDTPALGKKYEFVTFVFHVGKDESTIGILSFLTSSIKFEGITDYFVRNHFSPHLISILDDDMERKRDNIVHYLESAITLALAHIVHDL